VSAVSKSYSMCIIYVVVGAVLGGILGELLSGVDALHSIMPYLVHTYPVLDMQPMTVNLYVIQLTMGMSFYPNLMSIFGIVVALFLFRRY